MKKNKNKRTLSCMQDIKYYYNHFIHFVQSKVSQRQISFTLKLDKLESDTKILKRTILTKCYDQLYDGGRHVSVKACSRRLTRSLELFT